MRGRLDPQRLAVLLAVTSFCTLLGVAVTAAVVWPADTQPGRPTVVPAGWTTVTGPPGRAGDSVSYAVPGVAWEAGRADEVVSYRDAAGTAYARGHAPSLYYGNRCSIDGRRQPGGWAVLGDRAAGGDVTAYAVRSARGWSRGYAAGAVGASAPRVARVELADGTPAVLAEVRLDFSGADGECLGTRAELSVVVFPTGSGLASLVVARYVGVTGGVRTEDIERIARSVRVNG